MEREKKELRSLLLKKVSELPADYCKSADRRIIGHVTGLSQYRDSHTVFCYIGTSREINTVPLLERVLRDGKRLFVPRCRGKGIMQAYEITGPEDVEKGFYGILEPKDYCRQVEKEEIDLALIPCLSADRTGVRLGYGGGYYDRYLEGAAFPAICLCRKALLSESLPAMAYDKRVDAIITEDGLIPCLS